MFGSFPATRCAIRRAAVVDIARYRVKKIHSLIERDTQHLSRTRNRSHNDDNNNNNNNQIEIRSARRPYPCGWAMQSTLGHWAILRYRLIPLSEQSAIRFVSVNSFAIGSRRVFQTFAFDQRLSDTPAAHRAVRRVCRSHEPGFVGQRFFFNSSWNISRKTKQYLFY